MTLLHDEISELEIGKRFQAYLTTLVPVLTHPAQHDALRAYCHGLLLDGRKTIEPIAARLAPHRVKNAKQCLGHFLNHARWSYEALISRATSYALPAITAREPTPESPLRKTLRDRLYYARLSMIIRRG